MIRYTEYGIVADDSTENIDVYAYFKDEADWEKNNDVLSVASIYEMNSYKIEITNGDGEEVYVTYLEDSHDVNRLITFLDSILGVTRRYNNIDE